MASQSDTARTVAHRLEFGLNAWVVDEQRQRYLDDPGSVDQTWRDFFATTASPAAAAVPKPAAGPRTSVSPGASATSAGGPARTGADPEPHDHDATALGAVRVAAIIHAYRVRGHLTADTDPLTARAAAARPELDIAAFGLHRTDRTESFVVDGFAGRATMTLRLGAAEAFETFLQTKYVGQKRYSLEGGESAVVLLDALLLRAIDDGVAEAVIGMAHRGRLNVLANIVGKSYAQIFDEFEDAVDIRSVQGSGDVTVAEGPRAGGVRSPVVPSRTPWPPRRRRSPHAPRSEGR